MMDELMSTLSPAEQQAVELITLCLDAYNSYDGTGLFTGVERYSTLEDRVHLTAVQARSLYQWWALLLRKMLWPVPPAECVETALALLRSEPGDEVLRVLAEETPAVIMLARAIHDQRKAMRRGGTQA